MFFLAAVHLMLSTSGVSLADGAPRRFILASDELAAPFAGTEEPAGRPGLGKPIALITAGSVAFVTGAILFGFTMRSDLGTGGPQGGLSTTGAGVLYVSSAVLSFVGGALAIYGARFLPSEYQAPEVAGAVPHEPTDTAAMDACHSDSDCKAGFCHSPGEYGWCAPPVKAGAACARPAECESGLCGDGVCAELSPPPIGWCRGDADCPGSMCHAPAGQYGWCGPAAAAGFNCRRNIECASASCIDERCAAQP
jgi:hypothetical protein